MLSLGVGSGDEVIVPSTAVVMSAMPILMCGATPIFVDIRPNSFGIDINSFKCKVTSKTKCIISVPMWGYPTYSEELTDEAKKYGIPIVKDTDQAVGAQRMNSYEGTDTLCGCFSTHELKLLSTGEGGFLLTNNSDFAKKCRTYSRIGLVQEFSQEMPVFGKERGLNYKLNALAAGLGLAQLEKLKNRLALRKQKAFFWIEQLKKYGLLSELPVEKNVKPNYYGLVLLSKKNIRGGCRKLADELSNKSIYTDIYSYQYRLLPEYNVFECFSRKSHISNEFPNAIHLLLRLLVLPTHKLITFKAIKIASRYIGDLLSRLCI